MKKYLVTAATLAVLACPTFIAGKAHAATTTFNVTGTFNNCAGCSLGGNLVINTTTGSFVSEDVTVAGLGGVGPFTSLNGSPFTNGFNQLVVALADGNPVHNLDLIIPAATLVAYTGSVLCGTITVCTGNTTSELSIPQGPFFLASGSLTPAAVPLPGALPLFATGLGALGLLGWRRKRKVQAA